MSETKKCGGTPGHPASIDLYDDNPDVGGLPTRCRGCSDCTLAKSVKEPALNEFSVQEIDKLIRGLSLLRDDVKNRGVDYAGRPWYIHSDECVELRRKLQNLRATLTA